MNKELYQDLIRILNKYYPQIGTLRVSNVEEAKEFWSKYEIYKLFGPLPQVAESDKLYIEALYFLIVNYSQTLQDFCFAFSNYAGLFFFNLETGVSEFARDFVELVETFLRNLRLSGLTNEQKESLINSVSAFSAYEIFPALLVENLSFSKQKIGTLYRKALADGLKDITQDSQEYRQLKELYTKIRNKTYEFFTRKNRPLYDILGKYDLTQIYESSFNASFEKQTININEIDKEYRQAVKSIYDSKINLLLDTPYFSDIFENIGLDEATSNALKEFLRNEL
jgi:hypothetical protein